MPRGYSRGYRAYALGLMTAVYTLNLTDRALMGLLLEPIKADLGLTDTQLGFVTGIAFALFYATAGLPLSRWADRGNRSTIAALAIGLWGLTVMACLFVASFWHLVIARIAAAIGEAGCKPPTYSLVGDYFPGPTERTGAMAVYWLGSPLAIVVAFIAGGWLNEQLGWRMTFFVMGIPGLLLAVLVKATLREPRVAARSAASETRLPPFRDVLAALWFRKTSRHLVAAIVLFFFLGYGATPWFAALLIRSHGFGTAELGIWLGLTAGLCGLGGIYLGGHVSARWLAGDEKAQMRATAVAVALLMPLSCAFVFAAEAWQSLVALGALQLVLNFFFAPTFALLQRLVDDRMRATTLAVVMLLANLIGMGMGPQLIGALSDRLAPALGAESLKYSLAAVSVVALWSAWHFWLAGRTVRGDLALRG